MTCLKRKGGPTWLDQAKFIKNYAVDGCSTTLRVYLETGWAAETNLVMGIINESPKDFVRFLIRPKGARTQRHGIRGLLTNEAAEDEEAIVDTAKLAADTVRLGLGFEKPVFSELGTYMWEALNYFERGAFFLLFANVTENFAFDWYSGILLAPQSKCDIGRFSANVFLGPVAGHPFQYCGISSVNFPSKGCFIDGEGMHIEEGTWCITCTLQGNNDDFPHADGNACFQLVAGVETPLPCGGASCATVPAGGNSKVVKLVRVVSAPDLVAVQSSYHSDAGHSIFATTGGLMEGFRMY